MNLDEARRIRDQIRAEGDRARAWYDGLDPQMRQMVDAPADRVHDLFDELHVIVSVEEVLGASARELGDACACIAGDYSDRGDLDGARFFIAAARWYTRGEAE